MRSGEAPETAEPNYFIDVPLARLLERLVGIIAPDRDAGTSLSDTRSVPSSEAETFVRFANSIRLTVIQFYTLRAQFAIDHWFDTQTQLPVAARGRPEQVVASRSNADLPVPGSVETDSCEELVDHIILDHIELLSTAAQYIQLPLSLFLNAVTSSFHLTFATEIDWDALDPEPLSEWRHSQSHLVEQGEEEGIGEHRSESGARRVADSLAGLSLHERNRRDFQRYCLAYVRGAREEKLQGYFWFEKLDLLIELIWNAFMKLVFGEPQPRKKSANDSPSHEKASSASSEPTLERQHSLVTSRLKARTQSNQSSHGPSAERGGEAAAVELRRKTLRDRFDERKNLLSFIFAKLELCEPQFDSVIVVHKSKSSMDVDRASGRVAKSGKRAPFGINSYRNVPFCDLEAVFPHVRARLPPIDALKLRVQFLFLISFLAASVNSLWQGLAASSDSSGSVFLVSLFFLGVTTRLIGLFYSYLGGVTWYQRLLETWLLEKKTGTGPVVMTQLNDEVCGQETKEILLAYFFLYRVLKRCTTSQLSSTIEGFLRQEFDCRCSFEAQDAMEKLVRLGLAAKVQDRQQSAEGPDSTPVLEPIAVEYQVLQSPFDWLQNHPLDHLSLLTIR